MLILAYSLGSAMHAAKALVHPRWEDFNYEFLDGVKNRLHWLGDGNTVADRDPKADSKFFEASRLTWELNSDIRIVVLKAREYRLSPRCVFISRCCATAIRRYSHA